MATFLTLGTNLLNGMCYVMIDKANNKVVAAAICDDFADP